LFISNNILRQIQIILIAILQICGTPCLTDAQQLESTVTLSNDVSRFADAGIDAPLQAANSYIHRGDWEAPDTLLIVDDHDWRASIKTIADAAHMEGISVSVLTDQDSPEQDTLRWMKRQKQATILHVPHDTPWIRDYGPLQINAPDGTVRWIDFDYASDRPFDDLVPRALAKHLDMPIDDGYYYLEGGALISNGRGLCAITIQSLEEASVDMVDQEEFETFRRGLGCRALAVLPALTGESTGHADMIAQFLAPDVAAIAIVDESRFPDIADELDQAVLLLRAAANTMNQALRIVRLPMHIEDDVYYSYVNGTRLKKSYLVPSFEDVPHEIERVAYLALETVLFGIRLVPVPADSMVQRGGAVHCITLGLNLSGSNRSGHYLAKEEKAVPLEAGTSINHNKNPDVALPKRKEDKAT
jgi:agmatine/peptidylarginine deiminase